MAIISESELDVRLNHENNAAKGRTLGARNIPEGLRSVIGFQAHFEKAETVAEVFNVSPISAHLAKESRGHEESREKIQSALGAVKDQALQKMLVAMGAIKSDAVAKMKPFAALRMAKGLAEIVDKTSEKVAPTAENNVIIYAPQVRQENTYEKVVEIDRGLVS